MLRSRLLVLSAVVVGVCLTLGNWEQHAFPIVSQWVNDFSQEPTDQPTNVEKPKLSGVQSDLRKVAAEVDPLAHARRGPDGQAGEESAMKVFQPLDVVGLSKWEGRVISVEALDDELYATGEFGQLLDPDNQPDEDSLVAPIKLG